MSRRQVEHNASQIEKYLEVLLPKLEPGGGIPEVPMDRKFKGRSRPVVSDHVMRLWMANPHAGRINEVLRKASRSSSDVKLMGREMWKILSDVLFDHTAIRNWKAEGGKNERRFWMLCLLLAQMFAQDNGPFFRLHVHIHPEDEQQRQKTRTAQKHDTAYTDRRIVQRVESLEAEGLKREEAKNHLAQDPNNTWSYPRIKRAIISENKIKNAS